MIQEESAGYEMPRTRYVKTFSNQAIPKLNLCLLGLKNEIIIWNPVESYQHH